MNTPDRKCRFCEYFDAEGKDPFSLPDDYTGDCHNRASPYFTPLAAFSCGQFLMSTTLEADDGIDQS